MIVSIRAPLLENRDLGNGHFLAVLDAPEIASDTRPAQFVMLRVRDGSDPLLGRPFSVARVTTRDRKPALELLYKDMGRGTRLLAETRPGASVSLVGPLGRPFPEPEPDSGPVLMVAGGIGVAPFPILAEHLDRTRPGTPLRLLFGARADSDLVGRDLFPPSVEVEISTDDGSEGVHGRVTVLLERALDGLQGKRPTAYVCGPTPMMAAVDEILVRRQVTGHFSVETFMGCGFGVCLSCVMPVRDAGGEEAGFRRVCVDGPSFPAGHVDWRRSPPL